MYDHRRLYNYRLSTQPPIYRCVPSNHMLDTPMTAAPLDIPLEDTLEPTIRLESTTTGHTWLQYADEPIAVYNQYDCIATALAYPRLIELLKASGNLAYYNRWFGETVPMALDIQRRGFGHLDKNRRRAYRAKLDSELGEIDAKIMAHVSLFGEMKRAADEWRQADEDADIAGAQAKRDAKIAAVEAKIAGAKSAKAVERYTAKLRELEEAPLEFTKETSRAKRYQSKLNKIESVRSKFINSRGVKGHLATWLFGQIGFKPAPKAHKRPARSTAKAALMYIYTHLRKMDEPNKWILEDLFHRSRLNTIRSRYLHFPVGKDNRVYPRLRLYSAETFRWAYSDPPLHQWPPEIRHLIVPRPGYVFVAADYSQLEARIMAYLAGEKKDIAAFEDRSRDVHAETAQDIFGIAADPWGAMKPDLRKKHRNYAKKKRYEIGYGASEKGAAVQELFCPCPRCTDKVPQILALTPAQNKEVSKRWAVTRAATMNWREKLYLAAVANGRKWVSPWGYTRRFAAPAADARNSIFNCPMQSGAAEIINRAARRLYLAGWPIVLQMHDELILEVPAIEAQAAAVALQHAMEQPIPELNGAVFPVEVHIGSDWGELK